MTYLYDNNLDKTYLYQALQILDLSGGQLLDSTR